MTIAKPSGKAGASALEPVSRQRTTDSEKLTINLGAVDLGSIDLLVAEGFFSNRSDLIRTAVRNLLASHRDVLNSALVRQDRSLGLRRISRAELEAVRQAGQRLRISVVGLVVIDDDVTPALARDAIESLSVLGSLQASAPVRQVLTELLQPQGRQHQHTKQGIA
ncbi:MAG: CopG family transcriptional regulator [Lautropia sp.]|nr:CopG family transcriptional regulator [Lautropia sp.]